MLNIRIVVTVYCGCHINRIVAILGWCEGWCYRVGITLEGRENGVILECLGYGLYNKQESKKSEKQGYKEKIKERKKQISNRKKHIKIEHEVKVISIAGGILLKAEELVELTRFLEGQEETGKPWLEVCK